MRKEKYYIKSCQRASIHGFHSGDFTAADAIRARNNKILFDVYKKIQFGLTEFAYMNTGNNKGGLLYILSRDPQYSGAVRVSVFWRRGSGTDVEFLASSHKTFGSIAEFNRDNSLPSGWLCVVPGWYDKLKKAV